MELYTCESSEEVLETLHATHASLLLAILVVTFLALAAHDLSSITTSLSSIKATRERPSQF